MDPLGTLIVSLGALIVLDLAAHQLGRSRRSRPRTRAIARAEPGSRLSRADAATE